MPASRRWLVVALLVVAGCAGPGSGSAELSYSEGVPDHYHPAVTWEETALPTGGTGGVGELDDSGAIAETSFKHVVTFYGKAFNDCSDCAAATADDIMTSSNQIGELFMLSSTQLTKMGPATKVFENVSLTGGCYVVVVRIRPNRPLVTDEVVLLSECELVPSSVAFVEVDEEFRDLFDLVTDG